MAAAGTSGFATLKERGYFLLIDRLQCTLEDKIDHWRDKSPRLDQKKRRYFLAERLHVAFDVCAALAYLHSNQIIYRDLKPDNIGFDIRGTLVIALIGCRVDNAELETELSLTSSLVQVMSNCLTLDWPKKLIQV